MAKQSDVEKAAGVWRSLQLAAKDLGGDEKTSAVKAIKNSLRTLGKAVDAANAHDKWAAEQASQKPQPGR